MKFCSACGSELTKRCLTASEPERLVCTSCGKIHYENPLPTAGAFIVEDGKVLLVKRAVDPFKGAWDVPGGFLEKHEHPEEALKREMREELGVEISIQKLIGVFMGTYADADVSTLNFYYLVTIKKGTPKPASDVSDMEWFPLDGVPRMPFPQNNEAVNALQKALNS